MAMKEEKDHRPKEKRVTLLTPQGATGGCFGAAAEGAKGDDRQDRNRDKKEALSKVLIVWWHQRAGRVHGLASMAGNGAALFLSRVARLYLTEWKLLCSVSRTGGNRISRF